MEDDSMALIQAKFEGTWKLCRNENLDEFLRAMGMNYLMRKIAGTVKPTCKIGIEDGKICITTTAKKSKTETFKLNEEFETEHLDGHAKVTASFEDGKLKTRPSISNTKKNVPSTVRDIVDGEMVMELYLDSVVCKRIFKRIQA